MNKAPIAIVGMACEYPDARSPLELFENALAGRRAFRRIPDERLPLSEYGSDDPGAIDATTVKQAALIEGWSFDRLHFKTVGSTYRSADLTHWLALDVADRALRDAGFEDGSGLPRERTGVVLGNTLTGEFSRAQAMRLRWPYVRRVLEESLRERMEAGERATWLAEVEERYKAPFEPFGDESLAGGLANTIAGRICNYYDLKGGGFTVDGACASSLLAVSNACSALESGELDVALAGGVDLSLDPFELVGFARAGALAQDEMRVYDRRAEGFWPGEGCGVIVLMREEDAHEQGRRPAVRVRGWGLSSDGAGGISRPEEAGQLLALQRAYQRAGFGPDSVGYFEGHGTGTSVGDATELDALNHLLREAGTPEPVVVSSIKAHIGHTKAAAGIAGLIRASCALEHGIKPSLPACDWPQSRVDPARGALLRVLSQAEDWKGSEPRRAGVSSMGFGGINTHLVLEAAHATAQAAAYLPRASSLVASARDSELFLLEAEDLASLREQVSALVERAASASRAELGDWSAELARRIRGAQPARAALVASTSESLVAGAERLEEWLASDAPLGGQRWRCDLERGCFLGAGAAGRIGWLFPGQAAPVQPGLGALEALCQGAGTRSQVGAHRALLDSLGDFPPDEVVDTMRAQPAILSASLAALRTLEGLGVQGEFALGHSVGEITALAWAQGLSDDQAIQLGSERGRIMSELGVAGGGMLAVNTSAARAELLAKNAGCFLAVINGPRRAVLAGDEAALVSAAESAREDGIQTQRLPVSHAFHTPHMAPCAPALRAALDRIDLQAPERRLYSSRTGRALQAGAGLRDHLVRQLCEPVRFAEAAEALAAHADLLIEAGPGSMLSNLTREFLDLPVLSIDTTQAGFAGISSALAAAFALGAPLRMDALFEGRHTKPFDPEQTPRLFSNPCGIGVPPREVSLEGDDDPVFPTEADGERSALDVVRALAAQRCELPVEAVGADDRFLSDLHLTSIAVSDLASRAARELARPPLVAPGEFADATLRQLAEAIDSEERTLESQLLISGIDSWVRAFEVVELPQPAPRAASQSRRGEGDWRCFAAPESALGERLRALLEREVGGEGVLVHLPERAGSAGLQSLLEGCRAAFEGLDARSFVLVHHGDPAVAIARSLHQEARSLTTRVIEVEPDDPELEAKLLAEVRGAAPFAECRLGRGDTSRLERRLRLLPEVSDPGELPLDPSDVLLVTGGGKGISAECAGWLARRSGCRLALLGRALPAEDAALRENFERLRADGIRFDYASADVCDPERTRHAVDQLEQSLGPVTALIHGAGRNEPRSLASLELSHVTETVDPKLGGLRTLLDRLDGSLRCVVGFGSVIAQLGLPGEAHYAYANEALARELEAYGASHPGVRCLAVEWSIWSGVGMGDRLGRVEVLASQNISAISPEVGCAELEALLCRDDLPVRVFLSGRFGKPATLRFEEPTLPIRRFVERVREATPGVELIVDVELSHESDPWLGDHVYRGEPLVPGVLGLEAMAQVASALGSPDGTPQFESVRFLQPLLVPAGETCTVRIAALAHGRDRIEIALRSEATGFATDHMRALLHFITTSELPAGSTRSPSARAAVEVEPRQELYGELFFHGPRFERVLDYDSLHWNSCSARIESRDAAWFGAFQPQALELGDPGARDAAVHAIQACLPEVEVLPVGVERIERLQPLTAGVLRLEARERSRQNGSHVWDFALEDANGDIVERWHGLTLQRVDRPGPPRALAPSLLAPRLEEIAAAALPELALRAAVVRGSDREASARAASIAFGSPVTLRHRADGKPLVEGARYSSFSHAAGLTLAVLAEAPVACDLERIEPRDEATWHDLLGEERLRTALHLSQQLDEPLDSSAIRIWGVCEALRKLGASRDTPVLVDSAHGRLAGFRVGSLRAMSWQGHVAGAAVPLVATLLGAFDA